MYPLIYGGLLLLMRAHFRHAGAAVWLDGLVVGLATAAVGAALVFPDVLASSTGGTAAVGVSLAYPLGDFMLLVFVALGFTLSGWRPGGQWGLIGLGLVLSAGADMVFVYQEAIGTYAPGRILDTMWPASMALAALAAWQKAPHGTKERPADLAILLPAGFGLLAFDLLVSAGLHPLTHLALGLAAGAVFAAGLRGAWPRIDTRLLRLNAFKHYNDAFGHGAGDALLTNLGQSLAGAVSDRGVAYRLGGDEFCVLLEGRFPKGHVVIAEATAALSQQGSGFTIDASCGVVVIPEDASTVTAVLSLADERMYREKGTRGRGTLSQTQNVLLQLLTEREPSLRSHVRDVGDLAVAVGRKLKLDSEQLDELRRAAELHDIGKPAIPEEVLHKPGPLTEDEWRFMRQHTAIGARILNVAPALQPVSQLVRSSHERWDGTGYPDQLERLGIPLGARIIAACNAYDAMITERPYQAARSPEEAIAELKRHAGTQFDPGVVPVLCEVLANQTPPQEPAAAEQTVAPPRIRP